MHCSCSFPVVFFIALGIFLFIRWMKKIDRASRETAERMYDPTAPAVKPICPVCNDVIEGESAACPWCKAAHHPECFALNDGCGKCEFTTA